MRRWITKCMYECMYVWLHKGFPEYHAGETEAGHCRNAFWGLTSIVSDFVGHIGKELV